jgi:hypothetical protein
VIVVPTAEGTQRKAAWRISSAAVVWTILSGVARMGQRPAAEPPLTKCETMS